MPDRELLEFAAKAAGIDVVRSRLDDPACADMLINNSPRNVDQRSGPWNPLTDDGDALRLLVDLAEKDMVRMEIGRAGASVEFDSSPMFGQVVGVDRRYAARLAIVRAAAEIGKAMP